MTLSLGIWEIGWFYAAEIVNKDTTADVGVYPPVI